MMDTPTLGYLLAHPTALRITAQHPAALLLSAAAAVFVLWPHSAGRRATMLRVAAFACVVLALAGIELTTRMPSERLTVIAAADLSDSIGADGREWALRYLNELQSTLAPGDELGVVTFAGDVHVVRSPATPAAIEALPPPPATGSTDIGRALDSAMALLPADGQRRVLLLTDGNETRGDSRRQIAWLRAAGVRVDAAVPPAREQADVRVERLIAPPVVADGTPTRLHLIADNPGRTRSAVLNVYLDDRMVDSVAVELQPGRNALALDSELRGEGSRHLRAELVLAEDAVKGNNTAQTAITIRGQTRALVVSAHERSPLARALGRHGLAVDVVQPAALRGLDMLMPYHAVVLEDLAASSLPRGAIDQLEVYVRELGGGLVFAGGATTFGDAGFAGTALKRLLPVTLEPHRPRPGAREPLALFLVVDRSNSMGYNSRIGTLRDGEKLRYAKEAALAVVGQLKDQDLVGLIAFDSQPHEIAPLRPLKENRRTLEDLIPRLVENGGTDFYDALASAHDQLVASRVSRRHIILLTDGDTNRAAPDEYRALIKDVAADKISITTIRIGDNTVNLKLLKDISSQTGGEFHYVEDATQLPDLMLRETSRALSPAGPSSEQYYPELVGENQLLQGIAEDQLPPLTDYAYAKPKAGADLLLRVTRLDRRDPLLVVWHYGLGRVAAFTASPTDDGPAWLAWAEFSKFWAQLGQWTAREHADDEYAVEAQRSDGATELAVRSFGPTADGAILSGRLRVDDETVRQIDLVPREPRLFTATLLDLPPGEYALSIIKRTANGHVSERMMTVAVPATDAAAQAEFERTGANLPLLTQLTEATGGLLNPPARALAAREPGSERVAYPLDWLLLPAAMLLFLADVAVRKRPGLLTSARIVSPARRPS